MGLIAKVLGVFAKDVANKAENAVLEIAGAENATKAQIEQMKENVRKASEALATARAKLDKETRERDEAAKVRDRYREVAKTVKVKYDAETDPAKKADTEKALRIAMENFKNANARYEEEARDVVEVEGILSGAQAILDKLNAEMVTIRESAERAEREAQRASMELQNAKQNAQLVEQLHGLSETKTNNRVADMHREKADKLRREADAIRLRTESLQRVTETPSNDILKEVENSLKPQTSVDDEFKSLGL